MARVIKLKPCPFGCPPSARGVTVGVYACQCNKCSISGPQPRNVNSNIYRWADSHVDMLKRIFWNARTPAEMEAAKAAAKNVDLLKQYGTGDESGSTPNRWVECLQTHDGFIQGVEYSALVDSKKAVVTDDDGAKHSYAVDDPRFALQPA